jgi:hypothetical protein
MEGLHIAESVDKIAVRSEADRRMRLAAASHYSSMHISNESTRDVSECEPGTKAAVMSLYEAPLILSHFMAM